MDIPTYDQFVFPLLQILARHLDGIKARDAYEAAADTLGLTPEARAEILPSGLQPVYQNRIGWAHDRLKRRGLSTSPRRGEWKITDKGLAFLNKHADGVGGNVLRALTHVDPGSRASGGGKAALSPPTMSESVPIEKLSPEEQIDAAITELNANLSQDLLEIIQNASPAFFERLVLDVLHAMGYGGSRDALVETGGTGDGGIDGIVTLDKLGLEKVYVQAKRWFGKNVGRPDIQTFYGALAGRRARKGVFITTSDYSPDARSYAAQVSDSIVLVDGAQLTAFMIDYGVGVAIQRTIKIGRIDSDYFEPS